MAHIKGGKKLENIMFTLFCLYMAIRNLVRTY